jgi:hypothetical protein
MLKADVIKYLTETEEAAMVKLDERITEFGEIVFPGARERIRNAFKDAKELVRLFGKE